MLILFDDVIDTMYVVAMCRAFLSCIMLFISIALLLSCSGCPFVKERGSQKDRQQKTTPSEPMKPTWEVAD